MFVLILAQTAMNFIGTTSLLSNVATLGIGGLCTLNLFENHNLYTDISTKKKAVFPRYHMEKIPNYQLAFEFTKIQK